MVGGLACAIAIPLNLHADSTTGTEPTAGLSNTVAVVNGDPISRKALADAAVDRFGREVLETMINQHLILQACRQQGVEVTNQQVSEEVQRIAKKFNLTLDSYLQLLQRERGISPNEYSSEIVWPMLALRRLVADKVEVSEEEFNRAFVSQYGEAVKCRMIMVADRTKADNLQRQATANPDSFANLAKQFSEDETSASVGGLIPPIRRYNGDSRLEDAAFALDTKQVSEVLQLGDQWIILQAERRIEAHSPTPQAMPLISEQIKDRIRDSKMKSAAGELFTGLQASAKVVHVLGNDELSKQYPGAAAIINGQQISIATLAAKCIKRHGEDVLEGEIHRRLLEQSLRKAKKEVTDDELQAEVARAAVRFGFVRDDGSPDVQAWMESVTRDDQVSEATYLADSVWPSVALAKLVEDKIELTEQDLQQGFESSYGPRVEVLAIVLSDQRTAQKVWEMARDNPTDEFFGQLANQYSVEPVSSGNFGKVPPIRKHGGQRSLEKEAFQLKPGDLSGIVATGGQYIILRCQGFTQPVVTNPADVQQELVRDLTEQKRREAMVATMEQLVESSEIDNFLTPVKQASRTAPATR
jgi:parvulin-like peptidyl-prolyl isomerase